MRVRKITCAAGPEPRILILRLDRIGDLVLTTPLFKILKHNFPAAKITVLIRPGAKDILENNPFIENVVIHSSFLDDMHALKGRFDIVIDPLMNYDLAPALLARFINAECSIGFDIGNRGLLFSSPVQLSRDKKHFTAHFAELLSPLNIVVDPAQLTPEIYLNEKNARPPFPADQEEPLICIHPGGFYPSQRWPEDSFAQLITLCSQKYPAAHFALLGTENDVITLIMNRLPPNTLHNILSLKAGSLQDTIRMINRSVLFIGNNSGLLHIATALKVPTVSTMGPTIQWLWHPCGVPERNIVVRSPALCLSCLNGYSEHHTCLTSIGVDEMFSAVQRILA